MRNGVATHEVEQGNENADDGHADHKEPEEDLVPQNNDDAQLEQADRRLTRSNANDAKRLPDDFEFIGLRELLDGEILAALSETVDARYCTEDGVHEE